MREIKFRAWDVKLKEMFPLEPKARKSYLWELESHETWKVMQYTGLKDKNGVEIYEGDILGFGKGLYWDKASVEFMSYAWHLIKDDGCIEFNHHDGMYACEAEVIGNIYENSI